MDEIKTRHHYHVLTGLRGGYMPNNNETYTSRKSAEQGARWYAQTFREHNWGLPRRDRQPVRGSASAGWYEVGEWEYIEIASCDDSACVCQDCGELLPGEGDDIHRC